MEEVHNGLGFTGGLAFVVVDAKFSAGRGEQFTNAYQEDARRGQDGWDDFHEPGDEDGGPTAPAMSINTEIPDSNVGFKLLQKMGWSKGKGLGRNEDGITEPVRAGVDVGVRLGLGKQEQDDHFTNAELIERRKLETEIQANEDEDRKKKREAQAERDQKIREEVTEIRKTFYCDVCHKQYDKAMELEEHLSSYDHHHKKRLAEMRAMHNARTREERQRKEAKAMDKEMVKLQQQIQRANQQRGGSDDTPPPPPLPPGQPSLPGARGGGWGGGPPLPDEPPPPPPPDMGGGAPPPPPPPLPPTAGGLQGPGASGPLLGAGLSISLGGAKGPQGRGGGPGRLGGMFGGRRGGLAAGRGAGRVAAAGGGAFGLSSSDEEDGAG